MPEINLHRLRYHYCEVGSGEPTALMLHGFTGSGENWLPITQSLGNRIILPDLMGHGLTELPSGAARYTMEHASQDIAALIKARSPGMPVVLVGYSMGGRLALHVALTHPNLVRRLILESTSPGLATAAEREARIKSDEALAGRIEREGIAPFVNYWEALPLFASQRRLPETAQQMLHAQRLRNNPSGLAKSLRGMGTGAQPSLWDRLGELAMPVTLLAGAEDAKFVQINRAMSAQIPHARLHVIAEAGHTIHLEQPEVYVPLLKQTLE